MSDIIIIVAVIIVSAPLFYLHNKFINAVLEHEKSLYDDSDCPPGFTNYPGPM
jgi:hypothetical protein